MKEKTRKRRTKLVIGPSNYRKWYVIKQQFWASIRLPHSWPIANLLSLCACDSTFTIQHTMSCKKAGFINICHNDLRNLTATLLSEVCHDVQFERTLLLLTGE